LPPIFKTSVHKVEKTYIIVAAPTIIGQNRALQGDASFRALRLRRRIEISPFSE
jgi:hypothetical protein